MGPAVALLLGGVALLGLSHGFFIWPALATTLGMALTCPAVNTKSRPSLTHLCSCRRSSSTWTTRCWTSSA